MATSTYVWPHRVADQGALPRAKLCPADVRQVVEAGQVAELELSQVRVCARVRLPELAKQKQKYRRRCNPVFSNGFGAAKVGFGIVWGLVFLWEAWHSETGCQGACRWRSPARIRTALRDERATMTARSFLTFFSTFRNRRRHPAFEPERRRALRRHHVNFPVGPLRRVMERGRSMVRYGYRRKRYSKACDCRFHPCRRE
jgi:hypothetical protein